MRRLLDVLATWWRCDWRTRLVLLAKVLRRVTWRAFFLIANFVWWRYGY